MGSTALLAALFLAVYWLVVSLRRDATMGSPPRPENLKAPEPRCERGHDCDAWLDRGPCPEPDCPHDRHRRIVEAMGETQCPHCGYYCTGSSAFCTKHPDVSAQREKEGYGRGYADGYDEGLYDGLNK